MTIRIVRKSKLSDLRDRLKTRVPIVLSETAELAEGYSKSIVKVVSGELHDSISVQQVDPLHWRVIATSGHAIFVEFGTVYIPPKPFFAPAARAAQNYLHAQLASFAVI